MSEYSVNVDVSQVKNMFSKCNEDAEDLLYQINKFKERYPFVNIDFNAEFDSEWFKISKMDNSDEKELYRLEILPRGQQIVSI